MSFNVEQKIKEIYNGEIAGRDENVIKVYWSWYKGFFEAFHNYRIYNGTNFIYLVKKSLQMGKKVAETWADLLINEKCDVVIDSKAKEELDLIFDKTKFWTKANRTVELAFALGYAALIGEITKDKEMKFVTIDARNIIPISIDNERIKECAFYKTFNGGKNTRITLWTLNESNNYVVKTNDYDDKGKLLETNTLETGLDIPLYMMLKPNIVENNDNPNFGISIFANSIDTLKAIDTKYDGFDFEFIGGRKRIFVSTEAMKVVMTQDGQSPQTVPFDPLDSTFYNTGDVGTDGKPMVQEGSGDLRAEAYISALNFELGILSEKVGLGYGYFKFEPTGTPTATQVVSENSDLFRTLKKHEILIREELISFADAIIQYSNKFCVLKVTSHKENDSIDILFDDSIIEDKDTQKKNDIDLVNAGLMSYVDYVKKWEAKEEEDAIAEYGYLDIIAKSNRIMPLLEAGLITPELAIEFIYGKEHPDFKELVENLKFDPLNIDDGEFE